MRSKKLTALRCTKSSIPLPHSKVGINFAMLQSWHDDGIFDNFLNAALAGYCRHTTIKFRTIVRVNAMNDLTIEYIMIIWWNEIEGWL